jgi:hypothetical protein
MLRFVAAVGIGLHGLIHLIGFVVPWRLAELPEFAYTTAVLAGSIEIGDLGVRILGLLWLLVTVAFVVAAIGVARRTSWALPVTAGTAVASTILCVLALPDAVMGIVVNVAIVGAIALHSRSRRIHLAGAWR